MRRLLRTLPSSSRVGAPIRCTVAPSHRVIQRAASSSAPSPPPPALSFRTAAEYERAYQYSIDHSDAFWSSIGDTFHWFDRPATTAAISNDYNFDIRRGAIYSRWFDGRTTNLCYNSLDRHVAAGKADRVAIHWEGPDLSPGAGPTAIRTRTLTFGQLLDGVLALSAALHARGLRKGDRVSILTPIMPEIVIAVLACARLGLVHSVLGSLGSSAIADRLFDARPKLVITADAFLDTNQTPEKAGIVNSKRLIDDAVAQCGAYGYTVPAVLVIQHAGTHRVPHAALNWQSGRDIWYHEFIARPATAPALTARDVPCVPVGAEDPACILYTSGSTGKPKGVVHHAAGYMVYSATSFKYALSVADGGVYFCPNVNWVFYGPLCNATTQVLCEGNPFYPDISRIMQLVSKYRVTTLYPTANVLRQLQASDAAVTVDPYLADGAVLDRMRLIGSLGEPLSDGQWQWAWNVLGRRRVPIVDTWWQTETGGIMMNSLHDPDVLRAAGGVAARSLRPFFGIKPALLHSGTGKEIPIAAAAASASSRPASVSGSFVIARSWPSAVRTINGPSGTALFHRHYFESAPGYFSTGDGAARDAAGNYTFTGRIDDVFIVNSTRISSHEMESALNAHPAVAESAAVGYPHPVSSTAIYAWIVLRPEYVASHHPTFHSDPKVRAELSDAIRRSVSAHLEELVEPEHVTFVAALPKTRTGKILRRVLRAVVLRSSDFGDQTAIHNAEVIPTLIQAFSENPTAKDAPKS